MEVLPGKTLDPILATSPLALITSTSRRPFVSAILICISPKQGEPRAWRPTSCEGPRPSKKSPNLLESLGTPSWYVESIGGETDIDQLGGGWFEDIKFMGVV